MSKSVKSVFICKTCGYQSLRWLGKCPECASWDSLEEQIIEKKSGKSQAVSSSPVEIVPLLETSPDEEERLSTGISELDTVLGGGNVPGSVVMIGGDPGIGKSTLMLQMLDKINDKRIGKKIYVSGEESLSQIQQRAKRLNISAGDIYFLNETNLEKLIATLEKNQPALVIIDSVQTLASERLDGIPGYSSQLRFCTAQLVQMAKQTHTSVFLVGHVTKEGAIAGPKILEHIVDTVLYFEGENKADIRILRATKNRFGAVNEIALFQMGRAGLTAVKNPSEIFLSASPEDREGSAVVAVIEGNRPILVEVQALVAKTQFGMPQRTATGIGHRRMNLLLAVLEKKFRKPFGFHDVFIKTAAGLRIDEPAADLGICMALVSSMDNRALDADIVYIGEVGLSGELRTASYTQERISEAEKLGFKQIIVPRANKKYASKSAQIRYFKNLGQILN